MITSRKSFMHCKPIIFVILAFNLYVMTLNCIIARATQLPRSSLYLQVLSIWNQGHTLYAIKTASPQTRGHGMKEIIVNSLKGTWSSPSDASASVFPETSQNTPTFSYQNKDIWSLPVNKGLKETGEKALWVLVNLGFLGSKKVHRYKGEKWTHMHLNH